PVRPGGRGSDRALHAEARVRALAFLLAALALCWSLAMSARAAQAPSSIVVVTDDRYPPYLFRGDDGELQGHTKEKWDAWSRATGVKVELRGTRWAVAQQDVLEGEADVVDLLAYTPERDRNYDFSPKGSTVEARLYFQKSLGGIHDVGSLRG